MMRTNILGHAFRAALLVVGLSVAATASAAFSFYGVSSGGAGSAEMSFVVDGNTLTATLDNTSPITLLDGTGVNSPGITGFGFNLSNDPAFQSWTLTAETNTGSVVIIGGTDSTGDWVLGSFQAGVRLDYLPQTDGGVQGALYNPGAEEGLAALPNFFTTAVLTLNFDSPPITDFTAPSSPYVRMQNVGLNGAGSLKLGGGEEGDDPPVLLPEPATIVLFGLGLLSLAWVRRRFVR